MGARATPIRGFKCFEFRELCEKLSRRSHPSDLLGTDSTQSKSRITYRVKGTHLILLQCVFLCMGLRVGESDYLMKGELLYDAQQENTRLSN
jgi:hypothetical protein